MDYQTIISRLREARYKFTEAQRLRSEIKKLPVEDQRELEAHLRPQLGNVANEDIRKPLGEVIWH